MSLKDWFGHMMMMMKMTVILRTTTKTINDCDDGDDGDDGEGVRRQGFAFRCTIIVRAACVALWVCACVAVCTSLWLCGSHNVGRCPSHRTLLPKWLKSCDLGRFDKASQV